MCKSKGDLTCAICGNEIDWKSKYGVFKKNQVYEGYSSRDTWFALYKTYICENCLKKIKIYCKENQV